MKKFTLLVCAIVTFILLRAQDTTLNEYVGTYTFPEGGPVTTVDVKLENGSLVASSTAGSSPLERISKDTFNLVTYNGKVYFSRDSTKKVSGIKIEVEDTILEGKKESLDLVISDNSKYSPWKRKYRA
ncbi:MAG TPA: DUF3471 domain-containing protein [Chitinophagaceae bacterium]|jgi:hypothetical protein|nr:DUF3471 domain-containing protein [Chitinophagaceae bacterium]